MASVVRSESTSRDALPVCLAPWLENPYRLVSLWDIVKEFNAAGFCRASAVIGQMYTHMSIGLNPSNEWYGSLAGELAMLEKTCQDLGLAATLAQIKRLKPDFVGGGKKRFNLRDYARSIVEVQSRMVDELAGRKVFILSSDKAAYYADPDSSPFGDQVAGAFPSSGFDAIEASRCYSLGRNTACVFHLMRVLEIGLAALGTRFAVAADHTNWETIINQIEKAIGAMDKDPKRPANWKDEREFYSQCASHFRTVKDAWRNYTVHARGKYDEQEAFDMFGNVRGVMQKLATRLHE